MDFKGLEKEVYANVFKRLPLLITSGSGSYVWDDDGRKYLDFYAGIAVNCLGHAHPRLTKVIEEQYKKLAHVSNWVYTKPQLELAEKLLDLTGLEKVFFTNDGSESVECALKLSLANSGKNEFIAMKHAFHGRTLGALSLTWGDKYVDPFSQYMKRATFVDYGDVDAVSEAIGKDTSGVFVEPVQGEAGVLVPPKGYLKALADVTEDKGVHLIVDEVQTGFGRTGKMFAFEHEKIRPDILCLSKAMGNGFPIGACVYEGMDFSGGQHGGTFLGSPLACAVASEVISVIEDENLVENSRIMGEYLEEEISGLGLKSHGIGLMRGVDVSDGEKTVLDLIAKGVLTIYSGNVVRVLPALNIGKKHINEFIEALSEVI
ncbi:MAG: aminotransferase class III-fold pyridoxal phosphate-dependent enzyme [Methanobacteriota archaeon]